MRRGEEAYYLWGSSFDALRTGLGTTSLVMDDQGNRIAESRHYPYDEERWSDGAIPTDYRWTGQKEHATLGLYHMGARFYDSYINQFVSPDPIIPQPANSQSLNRYSYCLGNPLRYRDPTGYIEEDEVDRAEEIIAILQAYGVFIEKDFYWLPAAYGSFEKSDLCLASWGLGIVYNGVGTPRGPGLCGSDWRSR